MHTASDLRFHAAFCAVGGVAAAALGAFGLATPLFAIAAPIIAAVQGARAMYYARLVEAWEARKAQEARETQEAQEAQEAQAAQAKTEVPSAHTD